MQKIHLLALLTLSMCTTLYPAPIGRARRNHTISTFFEDQTCTIVNDLSYYLVGQGCTIRTIKDTHGYSATLQRGDTTESFETNYNGDDIKKCQEYKKWLIKIVHNIVFSENQ